MVQLTREQAMAVARAVRSRSPLRSPRSPFHGWGLVTTALADIPAEATVIDLPCPGRVAHLTINVHTVPGAAPGSHTYFIQVTGNAWPVRNKLSPWEVARADRGGLSKVGCYPSYHLFTP